MKILKKKKAQTEIMFLIIQGFILAAVAAAIFTYFANISTETFYEKDFLTKDMALLTNTLFTAQGNILYNYSLDWATPNFNFLFDSQFVAIREKIDKRITLTSFPYPDNLFYTTNYTSEKAPKKLILKTNGYDFSIESNPSQLLTKLKYPAIETKGDISTKKLVFISGIFINPITGNPYIEKQSFTKSISLINTFGEVEHLIQHTDGFIETNANLTIIFNQGLDLIIYIPSNPKVIKQSRKLATLIANSLIEKFPKLVPIIVPIQSDINSPAIHIQADWDLLKDAKLQKIVAQSINKYYTK